MNLNLLKTKLIFKGIAGGGTEARFICPFCTSNGYGADHRGHLYVNINTGNFMCHRCTARGTGGYLEKYLGLPPSFLTTKSPEIPKQPTVTKEAIDEVVDKVVRLSEKGYSYLISRGLSDEQILGYKFVEIQNIEDRVCIPLILDSEILGFQCRTYSHKSPKYLFQPTHIKIHDTFFQWDIAKYYKKVYLVEGIFDAISIGLNAVALFGHYLSNNQFKLLINSDIEEVVVVLDRDTEKESIAMSKKLSSYFNKVGYLKWDNIPNELKDIDDINKIYGNEGVKLVLKHQIQTI